MDKQKLSLLGSAGLGAGLGAGLMYLLDPQGGNRRRALARDKCVSAAKHSGAALGKTSRHLGNRTKGLVASAGSKLRREGEVDDQVLRDRVRSKLGRVCSHPSAIDVTVSEGRVTLRGPVLSSDLDNLLMKVYAIKGVQGVENQLEIHEAGTDHPSLQDNGNSARRWVAPASRVLAGTAGCGLAAAGLKRRDKLGAALGVAGLGLLAGGLSKLDAKRLASLRRKGNETGSGAGDSLHRDRLNAQPSSLPVNEHAEPSILESSLEPVYS